MLSSWWLQQSGDTSPKDDTETRVAISDKKGKKETRVVIVVPIVITCW